MSRIHRMTCPPPERVWERTPDGWTSREWRSGEKDQYAREVLGWKNARQPGNDEKESA